MTATTRTPTLRGQPGGAVRPGRPRWFAVATLALGAGLAGNTLLGPLFAGVVDYPFTQTVWNETLGLEAVSLILIAPLALIAGVLSLRGRAAGPALALGPAAYSAYMMVQYVVGPQYRAYEPQIALHLALFVLSAGVLLRAWTLVAAEAPAHARRWAAVVVLLAAFVVSRWLPVFTGMVDGQPVPAEPADVTMYWSIFLLDLGVVVPAAVVTVAGLVRDAPWARKALYAVVGWFALVPPSVAAMSIVKVVRDDPNANPADTAVFAAVALVVAAVAVALYRPLFSRRGT